MSKKKAETKNETVVYIGPTIRNVVRKNTFLTNGLTPAIEDLLSDIPRAADLIVPLSEYTTALKEVEINNSPKNLTFKYVKKNAKGRK